jgi:hypothetical protein
MSSIEALWCWLLRMPKDQEKQPEGLGNFAQMPQTYRGELAVTLARPYQLAGRGFNMRMTLPLMDR